MKCFRILMIKRDRCVICALYYHILNHVFIRIQSTSIEGLHQYIRSKHLIYHQIIVKRTLFFAWSTKTWYYWTNWYWSYNIIIRWYHTTFLMLIASLLNAITYMMKSCKIVRLINCLILSYFRMINKIHHIIFVFCCLNSEQFMILKQYFR